MAEYDRYGQSKFWVGNLLSSFMNLKKMNMDDALSRYQTDTNRMRINEEKRQFDAKSAWDKFIDQRYQDDAKELKRIQDTGAETASQLVKNPNQWRLYDKNKGWYLEAMTPEEIANQKMKNQSNGVGGVGTQAATVVGQSPDGKWLIMSDGTYRQTKGNVKEPKAASGNQSRNALSFSNWLMQNLRTMDPDKRAYIGNRLGINIGQHGGLNSQSTTNQQSAKPFFNFTAQYWDMQNRLNNPNQDQTYAQRDIGTGIDLLTRTNPAGVAAEGTDYIMPYIGAIGPIAADIGIGTWNKTGEAIESTGKYFINWTDKVGGK